MAGLNKVMLIGRLGKDPEVTHTQGGTALCKFSIATDKVWKDKDGEKHEKTAWHNIVVWGKLAEICGEYLQKGKQVYLEGELDYQEWEDKEGGKKKRTDIVVNNMVMLGGAGDSENKSKGKPKADTPKQEPGDDDVPF